MPIEWPPELPARRVCRGDCGPCRSVAARVRLRRLAGQSGGEVAPTASSTPKGSTSATGKYAAALAYSRCMRSHGVPNFPDPKQVGGGIQISGSAPGINPQSPLFSVRSTAPAGTCCRAAAGRPAPGSSRRSPGCCTSRSACGRMASRGSPIRRFLRRPAGPATARSGATASRGWRSPTRSTCDRPRSSGRRPRASL